MTGQPGAPLERDTDVVRYAGASSYDAFTGQVDGSAFHRKPKDVDGLSVTRRGMLAGDPEKDKAAIRRVVGARMTLAKSGRFFHVNVGDMHDALSGFGQDIKTIADPLPETEEFPANEAHALIIELPYKDMSVGSLSWTVAGIRIAQMVDLERSFNAV